MKLTDEEKLLNDAWTLKSDYERIINESRRDVKQVIEETREEHKKIIDDIRRMQKDALALKEEIARRAQEEANKPKENGLERAIKKVRDVSLLERLKQKLRDNLL